MRAGSAKGVSRQTGVTIFDNALWVEEAFTDSLDVDIFRFRV